MEKLWNLKATADSELVEQLSSQLNTDRLITTLLINRGVDTFEKARSFFRPSLQELHDPFLMKDMDKAVERLTAAIHSGEKVMVYGDYDVDGTTAVALVFSFLTRLGVSCEYYIPDRYTEGYGFSFAGVDTAVEQGISLIIALDCGIKDGPKVQYAKDKGIDVIICDHHNPGELPPALAVLDPKRSDCSYPFKGLSGCGVGFKLLQGFCIQQGIDQEQLYDYLDLLTISIGADIVPVMDENRILAYHGLARLAVEKRPGIAAMLQRAGFRAAEMTITDVVFILAPRINAAGRIYSGKQAVALLLTENEEDAMELSHHIEENNKTRKGLDKSITSHALEIIGSDGFYDESFTTVVKSDKWHKGVVGIVASRLVEQYYKPSIVLVQIEDKLSGSARSIPGIDLFDALAECDGLLEQFGGHTMAAGLSLRPENFEAFRQRFDETIKQMLNGIKPIPFEEYEAELTLDQIEPRFLKQLFLFAPFGPENMKPVFLIKGMRDAGQTKLVGTDQTHMKFHFKQDGVRDVEISAIGFGMARWMPHLSDGHAVDILCTIELNEWNKQVTVQLNVKDIKASH